MDFCNTGKIVNSERNYSLEDNSPFLKDIKTATNITIISAFYNKEYFKQLSDKSNANIKVILPAEKGIEKLARQKENLSGLSLDNPNLNFRLIDSGYLLHTKLYFIKKRRETIIYIGSSNASTNSLERCEELMLRLSLDELPDSQQKYITNYINSLQEQCFDFSEINIGLKTSSLRHFFSQGKLYTKTTEVFNPSIEIDFGEYHEQVMQQLENQENNPLAGLLIKATDKISILKLLNIELENNGGHEGIKKYGLFTTYGLWIPDGYISKAIKVIETSKTFKKREDRLKSIRNALKKENEEEIIDRYKEILKTVARLIGKQSNLFFRNQENRENINIRRLRSKLEWCRQRLNNEHFYELLLSPYYSSPMPNIWDDEYAVDDFFESFYNSLITENEKTKPLNLLYQSIVYFNDGFNNEENLPILKQLLKSEEKDRWFCQYDLKNFFAYNQNNDKYSFTELSDIEEIERGQEIFRRDAKYLIRGQITRVWTQRNEDFIRCEFEDGNYIEDIVDNIECYVIKMNI